MTKLLLTIMMMVTAGLAAATLNSRALAQADPELSPVAPPVVREGDFAVRLVEVLGLGQVSDEVEAESLLTARGVVPRHGWIADYPVTPVVMTELREAVMAASRAGSLPVGETTAAASFDALALELGLAPDHASVAYASDTPYPAEPPPAASYGEYPAYYDTYYADGPPIYTYYAPPVAYYGLYDWVPWPVYFTGISYSGFFILRDFHRHHHDYNNRFYARKFHGDRFRKRFVSNHHFDRGTGRSVRVRPARSFREPSRAAVLGSRRDIDELSRGRPWEGGRGLQGRGRAEPGRDVLTSRGFGRAGGLESSRRLERLETRSPNRSAAFDRREARQLDFREGARTPIRSFDRGEVTRSPRSLSRSAGDDFRALRSFGGGEARRFRPSQSFRGGGAERFGTFRSPGSGGSPSSLRSFGGGSGSPRSFSGGGFSGRGGGSFSGRGGGFSRGGGGGGFSRGSGGGGGRR